MSSIIAKHLVGRCPKIITSTAKIKRGQPTRYAAISQSINEGNHSGIVDTPLKCDRGSRRKNEQPVSNNCKFVGCIKYREDSLLFILIDEEVSMSGSLGDHERIQQLKLDMNKIKNGPVFPKAKQHIKR